MGLVTAAFVSREVVQKTCSNVSYSHNCAAFAGKKKNSGSHRLSPSAHLLAVTLLQLLEARVRAQRREVRAGIKRGKIVESRFECLLQRGETFLFVSVGRVCLAEKETVDGRRYSAFR